MIETARHLREIISIAKPILKKIEEKEASNKPNAAWSKKEIIGHLIDSACNNQQKFVRLMESPTVSFVKYQQNEWVTSQRYNLANWNDLINLWFHYNLHIAHIIEFVMPDKLNNKITIEGVGPFTLEFIMKDYVEHLKHHLKAIIPNAGINSRFENIYNQ